MKQYVLMSNEELGELEHFGVRGMKWGVRKERSKGSKKAKKSKKSRMSRVKKAWKRTDKRTKAYLALGVASLALNAYAKHKLADTIIKPFERMANAQKVRNASVIYDQFGNIIVDRRR